MNVEDAKKFARNDMLDVELPDRDRRRGRRRALRACFSWTTGGPLSRPKSATTRQFSPLTCVSPSDVFLASNPKVGGSTPSETIGKLTPRRAATWPDEINSCFNPCPFQFYKNKDDGRGQIVRNKGAGCASNST